MVSYYDFWETVFSLLAVMSLEAEVEDGDKDVVIQGAEALYADIEKSRMLDGINVRENKWTFTFSDGRKLTIQARAEIEVNA